MLPGSPRGNDLPNVRVLDLSLLSNGLKKDAKLNEGIPALLTSVMPNLEEIDLSNADVTESALRYFANTCQELEKLTWNNHFADTNITGHFLDACRPLKEMCMDDSVFNYDASVEAIQAEGRDNHIFCCCNTFLERVSLKNATFYCRGPRKSCPSFVLSRSFGTLPACVGFEAT
jgi:hypothetical protein